MGQQATQARCLGEGGVSKKLWWLPRAQSHPVCLSCTAAVVPIPGLTVCSGPTQALKVDSDCVACNNHCAMIARMAACSSINNSYSPDRTGSHKETEDIVCMVIMQAIHTMITTKEQRPRCGDLKTHCTYRRSSCFPATCWFEH